MNVFLAPLQCRAPHLRRLAISVVFALQTAGACAEGISALVQTVPAERRAIAQNVRAYGVVAGIPSSQQIISVSYTARIESIRVFAGQIIKRGMPLVDLQADPAARLSAAEATSAAVFAKGELERTRLLYEQRLATESQLAGAEKALSDAKAALAAQRPAGSLNGPISIRSPFDGVVSALTAAQGDTLQAGAAIMQLTRIKSPASDRSNVALTVDPGESAHIPIGAKVALHALAADINVVVIGHVVDVGASVDPQTQLVNLTVSADLEGTPLISGMRVAAEIQTSDAVHWVVPRSAMLRDDAGTYIFQIEHGKAHRVAVTPRVDAGDRMGVDGNLMAQLPVVSVGNYELQEGMAVRTNREIAQ